MAIARDPLVAGAAVRAWYDRQFGVTTGNMVQKNDHFEFRRDREKTDERKAEGIEVAFEHVEEGQHCEHCTMAIPQGGRVWTITIPPGREEAGRCDGCARAMVSSADDDGWAINGVDPREVGDD